MDAEVLPSRSYLAALPLQEVLSHLRSENIASALERCGLSTSVTLMAILSKYRSTSTKSQQ